MDENPFWTALKMAGIYTGIVIGFILIIMGLSLFMPDFVAILIAFFFIVFVVFYLAIKYR